MSRIPHVSMWRLLVVNPFQNLYKGIIGELVKKILFKFRVFRSAIVGRIVKKKPENKFKLVHGDLAVKFDSSITGSGMVENSLTV